MKKSNKLKTRLLLMVLCVFSTTSVIAQNATVSNTASVTREQNIRQNEGTVYIGWWGILRYTSNNERVRSSRELFSGNHEISHLYHTGRMLSTMGTITAITGACLAVAGFFTDEAGFGTDEFNPFRSPVLWVGVGAMAISLPFSIIGNSRTQNAVRMFNASIEQRYPNISMSFGVTRSGGVGLMFEF
jgi:hypothetical protein